MELKEYFGILMKRKWLIAAIVLLCCAATGIKGFLFTMPSYMASAKLVVNQAYDYNGIQTLDYGTIQSNIMLINSYMDIIQSSAIMDKVAQSYPDLHMTAGELRAGISVSSPNNSQIVNLTFTNTSYVAAAKAVNAIAQTFKDTNPSIMKVDNVSILNLANVEAKTAPINTSPVILIVISFIVSMMLAIGLVFLLQYLDDTLKSEQDIELSLGLPMLASIIRIDKSSKNRKKFDLPHSKSSGEDAAYATINQ